MSNPNCKTHHWNEPSLWEHGFNRCSSVLHFLPGLDELVRASRRRFNLAFSEKLLPDWVVWAVEVLTLLLFVVESCVRDGWVLFADLEGRKRKRQSQQNLVFSDEDDFEAMLLRNRRDHGWPQSCVKTCQVAQTSNLLLILVILLAGYSVTVPFFQGRTVTKPGFIILRYKEVGQFL